MLVKWKMRPDGERPPVTNERLASDQEGAAVPVGLDTRMEATFRVHAQLVRELAGRWADEDLYAVVRADRQEPLQVSGSRRRGLDEPGSPAAHSAARPYEQAASVPPDELRPAQ